MMKMTAKRLWTQQEDKFLKDQVNSQTNKNWVKIALKLNQKFGGQLRSAKQCRQRYINHASTCNQNPFVKEWDNKNIDQLFQLYEKHGSKWTQIALKIPNKSENIVKNKFYCSLRKFTRKLNKLLRSGKNKYKKQIRYQSIIRVLQAHEVFNDFPEELKQWSLDIRQKVIKFTRVCIQDGQIQEIQLQKLASNINKFNLQTRSYKAKKIRQSRSDKQCEQSFCSISQEPNLIQGKQKDSVNHTKYQKSLKELDGSVDQSQINMKLNNTCTNKSHSFISEEELYEDFGEFANSKYDNRNQCQDNTLFQMFPQEIQRFQFDGYGA